MSEPFIGQITMFAGNFAPRSWALCDGQLLSIASNNALFAILGTTYGGDGRTTFGLPDLRGRVPVHSGGNSTGPGLTRRNLGVRGGAEEVILNANQIGHSHILNASTDAAASGDADNKVVSSVTPEAIYNADNVDTTMHTSALSNTGGSQPHNNVMPFQCINYVIALFGVFPSRN